MFEANNALSYFVTNNWDFKNEGLTSLCSFLRLNDVKNFEYRDDFFYDRVLELRYFVLGYRRYLLNENDKTIDDCRKHYKRLSYVNLVINLALCLLPVYFVLITFDKLQLW